MGDSPISFICDYYHFSEYEIKDGIIKPTASAQKMEIKKYNPFDFFKSKLYKRPDYAPKIDKLPIHVSFSAIKSNEDALEWVNNYGFPFSYYINIKNKDISYKNFPDSINSPELKPLNTLPIEEICKNAELFCSAIDLYNMIKKHQIDEIRKVVGNSIFKENYEYLWSKYNYQKDGAAKRHMTNKTAELWDNTPASDEPCPEEVFSESDPYYLSLQNEPISLAQDFLSMLISCSTNSVRETLIFDQNLPEKPPKIGWIFSSLLALLYKMLLLDWSQGYSVQRCANKNCNKMFVPFNDKSNYCCKACGDCVRSQKCRDKKKMAFINAI